MQRFPDIDLITDQIPDEATIMSFLHLVEKHHLGEQILETVEACLSKHGMTIRQGTANGYLSRAAACFNCQGVECRQPVERQGLSLHF